MHETTTQNNELFHLFIYYKWTAYESYDDLNGLA